MSVNPLGFTVCEAVPDDAEALYSLYANHLAKIPPENVPDFVRMRGLIAKFSADPNYHLLIGEVSGELVSSVTLVVVENLTHNMRPYAVIENVVTHANYRGSGYATTLIAYARELAIAAGCYKIMLLTGSKREETLRFYERCGFDRYAKQAFLMKL